MGCRITVKMEGKEVLSVKGNTCPRGEAYARQECVQPMRILTSTVRIKGGTHRVLPVITEKEIPLELMEKAMAEVREVTVDAPVEVNTVVLENIAGTGVNLIASRSMKHV
jgi:CxxC motif-containing protein